MYSDLALSIMLEVKEGKVNALHNELKKILVISDHNLTTAKTNSAAEWILFLNISFGQGKGKISHVNPAVPG